MMFQMLSGQFLSSILGIPLFVLYLAVAVALLSLFALAYIRTTRHDEIGLIRGGNIAAALGLGGSMVGFVIPLSRAVSQATSIPDVIVWGLAAFIVQLSVFYIVGRLLPDLPARIERNDVAAGVLQASAAIATGMLNAAAMTA